MPRAELTLTDVRERMLKMLAESGLDKDDAKAMRVQPLTADSLPAELTKYRGAGFVIPYLDQSGKPTKFYRFRYVEDVDRTGFAALIRHKQLRYVQPSGMLPSVYWAPSVPWKKLWETDQPIFITEGEKKAACGCKYGFATLGLGGVWSFKSKDKNVALIKELADLDWEGRRVYVAYDSDAVSNRNVLLAETELAKQLLDRGALMYTVRIPENLEEGKKVGLDDFIVQYGRDAFQKLVDTESQEFINSAALHDLNRLVTFVHSPTAVLDNFNFRLIPPHAFVNATHSHLSFTETVPTTKKDGSAGDPKMVVKRTAAEWMKWPGRSTADSIEYEPGAGEYVTNQFGRRALNTWPGWGVEPKKGDLSGWTKLRDFVFQGAKPEHVRWFEQWLAYPIQYPGTKLFSAVVVWGVRQGTGKSFVAHIMKRIYGSNFAEIGMEDLNSSFNGWAVNKQFVLAEEITSGENKRVISDRLKKMITQPEIMVNQKYIAQYSIKDCANFYFTSNHPNAFYLEDTDRRFFVHEVRREPMSDADYREIDRWKEGDGPAALMHYLLHMDLSEFNPKAAPPLTEDKVQMRIESKSEIGQWVLALQTSPEGVLIVAGAPAQWTLATTRDLYRIFDPDEKRQQLVAFSHELRRANVPRANEGRLVKIGATANRLWIVGGDRTLLEKVSPKRLAEIYIKEHGDGSRKF